MWVVMFFVVRALSKRDVALTSLRLKDCEKRPVTQLLYSDWYQIYIGKP